MPPLIRFISRVLPVSVLCLASASALAEAECIDRLEVVGAEARYTTRMFKGKPTRRDVRVAVQMRSTATAAISWVELGVFLGASLEDVSTTRPEALPTRQTRALPGGGIAFRAEQDVIVPAGAKRTVEVVRKALPLEKDLYGVRVVPVRCKRVVAVGEVVVEMPPEAAVPSWLLLASLLVVVATAVVLLVRLRR